MTKNKTFERKCVACRSFHNKYEMLRLAKTEEGVFIDKDQKYKAAEAMCAITKNALIMQLKRIYLKNL